MTEQQKTTCEEKNRRLGLALKLGIPLAALGAFSVGQNVAPSQPVRVELAAVECKAPNVMIDQVVAREARVKVTNVIHEK